MINHLFCANQELHDDTLNKVMHQQQHTPYGEGALGRVDEMLLKLASHQQTDSPKVDKVWVSIFAGDHGIANEEVSDFESAQSQQWVEDLCQNKALSNALINETKAQYEVVDVGLNETLPAMQSFVDAKVANGTQNFVETAAMTQAQLVQAMEVGISAAERAKKSGADLFIGGELGVANTSSALAMIAVLSDRSALDLLAIGRSRVMRSEQHKAKLIDKAIIGHQQHLNTPLKILQHLGGFETAALCGAYIRCAQLGLTIVVDGLMATVAAWIADLVSRNNQLLDCQSVDDMMPLGQYSVPETLFCICGDCPRLVEWCFFSHQSAENYHAWVLEILAVDPILQFDMRIGQASGALMVVPLLQQACYIHAHLLKMQPLEVLENETLNQGETKDCPFSY